MDRRTLVPRLLLALLVTFAVAAPVSAQWPPTSFKNLKVFPKDIPPQELIGQMRGFTRALGVRCTACHVGEEGKPLSTFDFASDEKPAKEKARAMIRMTQDINAVYLAKLERREDPPVQVECMTCHHGVREPRKLEDVLANTYDRGGLDSTIVRYNALRERYYGRAAYDFGETPLAEVASHIADGRRPEDAVRIHALNVEMNPKSNFAKRIHASSAIAQIYVDHGAEAGWASYEDFQSRYGDQIVNEALLTEIAGNMLAAHENYQAIAALTQISALHPNDPHALVNLATAYAEIGEKKKASIAYKHALAQDPTNEAAKAGLEALKKKK
jgi:tetratricopeptide (TPR) repeat protein